MIEIVIWYPIRVSFLSPIFLCTFNSLQSWIDLARLRKIRVWNFLLCMTWTFVKNKVITLRGGWGTYFFLSICHALMNYLPSFNQCEHEGHTCAIKTKLNRVKYLQLNIQKLKTKQSQIFAIKTKLGPVCSYSVLI